MRRLLLSTAILVSGTGLAAADVTVGGDGYFGAALGTFDDEGVFETRNDERSDYVFVYDLDIDFTATGTSDSGLTFGASIDLDDAASNTTSREEFVTGYKTDANGNVVLDANGNPELETSRAVTGLTNNSQGPLAYEGELFVSGDFGTLSMGDLDSAAEGVVGDLAGVGITGLGDFNEFLYLVEGSAQPDGSPLALYTYELEACRWASASPTTRTGRSASAIPATSGMSGSAMNRSRTAPP